MCYNLKNFLKNTVTNELYLFSNFVQCFIMENGSSNDSMSV